MSCAHDTGYLQLLDYKIHLFKPLISNYIEYAGKLEEIAQNVLNFKSVEAIALVLNTLHKARTLENDRKSQEYLKSENEEVREYGVTQLFNYFKDDTKNCMVHAFTDSVQCFMPGRSVEDKRSLRPLGHQENKKKSSQYISFFSEWVTNKNDVLGTPFKDIFKFMLLTEESLFNYGKHTSKITKGASVVDHGVTHKDLDFGLMLYVVALTYQEMHHVYVDLYSDLLDELKKELSHIYSNNKTVKITDYFYYQEMYPAGKDQKYSSSIKLPMKLSCPEMQKDSLLSKVSFNLLRDAAIEIKKYDNEFLCQPVTQPSALVSKPLWSFNSEKPAVVQKTKKNSSVVLKRVIDIQDRGNYILIDDPKKPRHQYYIFKSDVQQVGLSPLKYTKNIKEWLNNPAQALENQGYNDSSNKKSCISRYDNIDPVIQHTFPVCIDDYIGKYGCSKNDKKNNIVYVLPGAIKLPDLSILYGFYIYLINKKGECFHRLFDVRTNQALIIETMQDNKIFSMKESGFYKVQFPSTKQ